MTDVITLGISGWFTPHGTLYHEEGRTLDEIAPEDWSNLLAHADAIDFFTRPDPAWPALEARIFHLTITDGERSRELAVNDPFEAPELAGPNFQLAWGARPVWELFDLVRVSMPPGQGGALGDEAYTNVVAYILQANGVPAGTQALAPGQETGIAVAAGDLVDVRRRRRRCPHQRHHPHRRHARPEPRQHRNGDADARVIRAGLRRALTHRRYHAS